MANNNNNWPVLLLGGLATFAAITSAGYLYNKLQPEEELPVKQEAEREEDEIETEIKRQERKVKSTGTLSRNKKLSLMAKLEVLIRELEQTSRSQNRMLMKRPIDEIQMLIQEEPSFRDGVYDPDVILILSGMYALIGDYTQQKKCLLKCAEKFDPLTSEYLSTCQKLVAVCALQMNYEESSKWAELNLKAWKALATQVSSAKNIFDLANSHSSYAITLMRVGKFKESCENFRDALEIFSSLSPVHDMCFATVKNYLATVLAAGDIEGARIEADSFLRQFEESESLTVNKALKEQHIEFIIQLYHSFGSLLRNNENFEFAIEYFERCEKYTRDSAKNVSLQLLVDSANVYWELENKERAIEKEKIVRDFKTYDGFKALVPLSRSKYLQSTFAVLLENYYYLKVQLIPKSEGPRPEGVQISTSPPVANLDFKGKLNFIVTFENTEGDNFVQEFTLLENQKDLVIQSKIMQTKAKVYQFYKVHIQIVNEEGTTLGEHHQLILSPNPQDVDEDAFLDA